MKLTINYIENKFELYNQKYFYGLLKKPHFKIKTTKRQLGCLSTKRVMSFNGYMYIYTISISDFYNRNEKQYDNTLIHEMIHLYIAQQNLYDNGAHGRRFKAECARINKDGWELSRTTNTSGWELSEKAKDKVENIDKVYNVITYLNTTRNKYFIFCVAKGNVQLYINHLKQCGYKNINHFKSRDAVFETFPICRNRVRGYWVDKNLEKYVAV